MIRKPDLRIDTQFFDDNLNGFNIPQAIKVTQSIDTQTFIKEGLNQDGTQQLVAAAIQTIEKIMSQRLFQSFVNCWNKLKQYNNDIFIRQNDTPFSQKRHKRQSPQDIAYQEQPSIKSNAQPRGLARQKILLHKLSGAQIDWLEEQRRKIIAQQKQKSKIKIKKSVNKSVSKGVDVSVKKSSAGETHFERAKVLKEIVDKLKYGRNSATNLINQIDNKQQDEQLHYKLSRLERLMEDVHYSSIQKGYATQRKKPQQHLSHNTEYSDAQLEIQLKNELVEIKKQMQKIRFENQRILKQEEWKRSELHKIASTKQEMQSQYIVLKSQIDNLEAQKRRNLDNQLRMQQQLSHNSFSKQQYERQIAFLSQRVAQTEKTKTALYRSNAQQDTPLQYSQRQPPTRHIYQSSSQFEVRPITQPQTLQLNRQPSQMVPLKTNPFGYSTFATSQKQSQTINWQQNTQPVGTHLPFGKIDEQGRQAADEWACC